MKQFEPSDTTALVPLRQTTGPRAAYADVPVPYNTYDGGEESGSDGLFEYWRIVRRYKRSLFLFSVCGALLAALVGLFTTPVYKARTSLEVLNLNENFMNMKTTSPESTNDDSFDTSEEENQAQLLQSEALLKRVFQKLDPDYSSMGHRPAPPGSWLRTLLHMTEPMPLTSREKLLGKAEATLTVRTIPHTRLIEVAVKSTDPQLATYFANTLANEFIEQSLEARWKTTQKTSEWLSRELESERVNLERSENELQAYARKSGLIFTDENTTVATEKLEQVQMELSKVTAARISMQSRYELAKNVPPDSLPDVLNDPPLRDAAGTIAVLRAQIAQLSATYGPEYGKLQQAQAQLAELESSFLHDRDAILARITNDYQEAKRKEELLAAAYVAQTGAVTGLDEKAVKYNILKREADSNRQLYETMLLQLKQSSMASAIHATNVHVVDPAEVPGKSVWPNYRMLIPMGLMAGLLLGFGVAMIRERADRSLQQPGETQIWTNLPELGIIPMASENGERKPGRPVSAKNMAPTASPKTSLRALGIGNNGSLIALMSQGSKSTLMLEAFRATLTSILFIAENFAEEKGTKVLLFTSGTTGEGKTTVVSNLAVSMAEIRRKVLIVDADLRRPMIHNYFGLSNERGLNDLLMAETLSDDAVNELIQETEIPGLHVLTSGPPTQAAANLVYSPNLAELLAKLKNLYDMILIDTPPMLQMTDARVVGRLADAVILIARAQQTTRGAMIAASQRFSEDRIRVLGTILNGWDPKSSPNGFYGYYGYIGGSYTPSRTNPSKTEVR